MSFTFESFVATRYLRSKRKEVFISIITVISVIAVAVSVMVLNIVMAVMTGFEEELQSRLIDAGAHITVRKFGGDIENPEEIIKSIREVPSVTEVTPFTVSQVLITGSQGSRGLLVRGVTNDAVNRDKIGKLLDRPADFDRLFEPQFVEVERPDGEIDQVQLPPLVIGKALQDRLSLFSGTPVTLMSPQLGNSPQGLIPKVRRFLTVGVYTSGLVEFEAGLAYTSLEEAQKFFSLGSAVSGIDVTIVDLFQARAVADKIIEHLGEAGSGLYATDWTEPNKPLWEAMALEKQVYFIVLLLLVLIASVTIVNTLVMVVMEKARDIAVMKSMGASDRSVLTIFILQGAIIGLTGVFLGTLLGYLGCVGLREFGFPLPKGVFPVDQAPVYMKVENFVIVATAAFFTTLLAGIYPAYRAARLRPAEVLRFE